MYGVSVFVDFFKKIRLYLEYPPEGCEDYLKKYINELKLSDQHKDYLGKIVVR